MYNCVCISLAPPARQSHSGKAAHIDDLQHCSFEFGIRRFFSIIELAMIITQNLKYEHKKSTTKASHRPLTNVFLLWKNRATQRNKLTSLLHFQELTDESAASKFFFSVDNRSKRHSTAVLGLCTMVKVLGNTDEFYLSCSWNRRCMSFDLMSRSHFQWQKQTTFLGLPASISIARFPAVLGQCCWKFHMVTRMHGVVDNPIFLTRTPLDCPFSLSNDSIFLERDIFHRFFAEKYIAVFLHAILDFILFHGFWFRCHFLRCAVMTSLQLLPKTPERFQRNEEKV